MTDALLAATDGGAIPAPPPDALAPAVLARGASRFAIYCAVCHGERGDGQSIVARNMVEAPPPSLLTPTVRALTPGQLYVVITRGMGRMPSYAADLPDPDRWAVIAYLGALQRRGTADTSAATDSGGLRP